MPDRPKAPEPQPGDPNDPTRREPSTSSETDQRGKERDDVAFRSTPPSEQKRSNK